MVKLCDVLARVESGGSLGALRFEPATYARLSADHTLYKAARAACIQANQCSDGTATMILSTSWGKYQLMGFNLYPASVSKISDILASEPIQTALLDNLLSHHYNAKADASAVITDDTKRAELARFYNGPGNVSDYSAKLLAAYKALNAS